MIWLIAKKDFLLNLISVRFFIGLVLCLIIIPFTMIISADDFINRQEIYNAESRASEKCLEERTVWSTVRPNLFIKPETSSMFSRGITDNMGNRVQISFDSYPLFPTGNTSTVDNPLLKAFSTIDFSRVIAILISLLALVFAYDSITKEKEDGTMKLNFTGQISRISFLFAKLLGILLTLLPILALCYLIACLILIFNPAIYFSTADWQGIALLFLASIVYMVVFIMIGMVVSASVKRSSSSIIICLLGWIWFLFLVPTIATYLAQSIKETPSYDNMERVLHEYSMEYEKENDEKYRQYRNNTYPPGMRFSFSNISMGDDGYIHFRGAPLSSAIDVIGREAIREKIAFYYADKKWSVQKDYLDNLVIQKRLQKIISYLSPSEIFRNLSETICKTDVNSYLRYMEDTRNYRETLIRFFQENNISKSITNYTTLLFDEIKLNEELAGTPIGDYFETKREEYKQFTFPFDLSKLPRFVRSGSSTFDKQSIAGDTAGLVILFVVLLFCSIAVFTRYDIR